LKSIEVTAAPTTSDPIASAPCARLTESERNRNRQKSDLGHFIVASSGH
jgi:hypothetical protein